MNGFGGTTGARAASGSLISFGTGSTLTIGPGGGGNTGLVATGSGSRIVTNGLALTMSGGGGGDTGVRADTAGTITLNGGSVTVQTNGGGETGLQATGANSAITTSDTTISVTGGGSRGAFLQNGGAMTLSGGSLTTSGGGSVGFLLQAGAGVTNTLNVSGTTINTAADAFAVQGGTGSITLTNGTTATGGNGILLSAAQNGGAPAIVAFSADASQLTGAIRTDSASTNNVTLTGNTLWTMTGTSNLTNLSNSASTIAFAAPSGDPTSFGSYKTLTASNYIGAAGRITLNTYLADDSSPTDQLVINGGSASGSSAITVINTGGPGALTQSNGIPVVVTTNGGTTAAGAFHLGNVVEAGPYTYLLFRGGIGGNAPDNWFLRSDFAVPPTPPTPPRPEPPIIIVPPDTTDPFPHEPPPDPLPPGGTYPIVGPRLSAYGVVQPLARQLGQTMLGTMHERIGDTLTSPDNVQASAAALARSNSLVASDATSGADANVWAPSAWSRIIGVQIADHLQAYADPSANGRIIGFQAGLDLWRGSVLRNHRDVAGLYIGYLNAEANVTGLVTNADATAYTHQTTGSTSLNGYSLGAYWTHYGPSGWYVDTVLQGTFYSGTTNATFQNLGVTSSMSTSGGGVVVSLEGGYPLHLAFGPGFILEPQAQFVFQHVGFNETNDGLTSVDLGSTSGTTGRLGLRGQWSIADSSGRVWEPYLRGNIWRNWGSDAETLFSRVAIPVPLVEQSTSLEFAGGLTIHRDAKLSLFIQAGYQFTVAPKTIQERGLSGDVGLRYAW
jgi:outer membrane autotransporter protein